MNTKIEAMSATKSVVSIAMGILLDKKFIDSLDQPVHTIYPEWETRKKILLTGASGTVGLEVLKQLCKIKDKYEVTVFDIKSGKTIKEFLPFKEESNIIYGNINNDNDLIKVCYDKDVVIHLAAIIPPLADDNPALSYQVFVWQFCGEKNSNASHKNLW